MTSTININDKVSYKLSKHSMKTYYGKVLGFKMDKIHVSKYKYSDYSSKCVNTYIDVEDIIKPILLNKTIDLSKSITLKDVCKCDECNEEVDYSFGDLREKVFRFDDKNQVIPSSVRILCSYCIDELFNNHEPDTIFD